jgi:hypothetical protein
MLCSSQELFNLYGESAEDGLLTFEPAELFFAFFAAKMPVK